MPKIREFDNHYSNYKPMNNESLFDTVVNILENEVSCGDGDGLKSLLMWVPAHVLLGFVRGSWDEPQPHNGIPANELLDDDDYAKGEPTYEE
jgi:hypothetical protein